MANYSSSNSPEISHQKIRESFGIYAESLHGSSNVSSNICLGQLWSQNDQLQSGQHLKNMIKSVDDLLSGVDNGNSKQWKTSLSKIDPLLLFSEALPLCKSCTEADYQKVEFILNNECSCKGLPLSKPYLMNETNIQTNTLFGRNNSVEGSSKDIEENKGRYKPIFNRQKPVKAELNVPRKTVKEIDLSKVEEEEKAHKSSVAKIMFKSAREQLLASNPAARRALGISRKAQGKFVSPMIGAQSEKQETSDSEISDERLKHIDPKMIELIESEIIDKGTRVGWEDIAGLQLAKSVIQEAVVWPLLRPDIFTGLRRPPKGILLFGPPGTGKTLIGKCIASQCNATFFSISASSLTSKWIGDGEKMVRALFAVARCHQPAVIFIDEIDSLLTQRSDSEHEATRRIKTEFLVQFDGAATGEEDKLLIVGATNRPQELDEAARRRLVKRLYIPLPDVEARQQIISRLLSTEHSSLSTSDMCEVARLTSGYSGADMKSLCSEAAMGPVRAVPLSQIVTIDRNQVRPVCLQDFINALQRVKPSVSQDDLGQYVKWNSTYGQGF